MERITSSNKEVSVKKFIKEYFKVTYVDESYQRFEVWDNSSKKEFILSLYKGLIANSIIIIHVGQAKYNAEKLGNKNDYNYFQSIEEMGYKYISIDGNNRSQTINKYYNNEMQTLLGDEDREEFEELEVSIVVFENITKEDIHQLAIVTNKGTSWNAQESRNAINSEISYFIRDTRKEVIDTILTSIKKSDNKRMIIDETIVKMLSYEVNGKTKLDKKILDSLYKREEVDTRKFKTNIKTLKTCLDSHGNRSKMSRYDLFNLYCVISYFNKNNIKITNTEKFYTDFYETNMLRKTSKTKYNSENGKTLTWDYICGNFALDYDLKLNTILGDLNIGEYTTKLDNKRGFSLNDKINIWEKSNGKVRVNNNDNPINNEVYNPNENVDFIEVTISQLLTEEYVVDHIIPHGNGGETDISNGEITSKDFNLWKSNKFYDSMKESLVV